MNSNYQGHVAYLNQTTDTTAMGANKRRAKPHGEWK
ncbi:hypothetical protein CNBG_5910 [Cryptococcus deuterogattii R265]|nr:hypothetical protein CNBG_5910 [Cryptococcus deuterogattii R265]